MSLRKRVRKIELERKQERCKHLNIYSRAPGHYELYYRVVCRDCGITLEIISDGQMRKRFSEQLRKCADRWCSY